MSFLQRTGRRFAASAVMAACFAVSSAFAAMLATNDFETSYSGFTPDSGDITELVELSTYNGDSPSGSAAYPFADFGSKYLAVDSDTNTIWRAFDTRSANTYFDSYVQFTPMYGDFESPDDAKFVIFLDSATSNLCVVSGTSENDRTPVTNRLDSALVEPNSWGHLTVSAISGDVFSFQIRVNGTLLTAGGTGTFYSMAAGSLAQVGFSGTGALDNFAVRTTDPYIQNPVATIDGEGYASFEDAISEASAGATIVLHGNASLSAAVSKALTIDLGGNTLSSSVYQTNLTIADSAETHGSVVFTNGGSVPPSTGESVNVLAGLEDATLVMDGYVPRNIADGSTYSVVALANDCAIYSTRCNDNNTPTAGNANVKWQAFTLASASTAESLPVGAGSCYLFNIAGDNLAAASTGVSIKSITVKWGNGTHHLATIGGSVDCDAYLVITTDDDKIVAISNVNDSRWAANGSSTFAFDGTVLSPATAYRAQFVTSVDGLSVGETLTSAVMGRVNGRFHTSSKYADSTTACYGDSQQDTYSVNMSIVVEKAVAFIGSIGYPTLNSALSAAGTESEATISLIAACSETVTIPENVTVAVADGVAFSGTVAGAGTIVYTAAPSGTLAFGAWTGTVNLNYENIVSTADFAAVANARGIAGSWVEIGENGTASGYMNSNLNPSLKVSGFMEFKNGSTSRQPSIPALTGDGVVVFSYFYNNGGETTRYTVSNLVDWNGVITNASSVALVMNIVSGSGSVVYNVQPSVAPAVGAGYFGEVVVNFNWQNVDLSTYSGENATLVLNSMTGYFAQSNGGSDGITGKVRIDGDVVVNNGWPVGYGNWTHDRCVKFADLTVDGSLTLAFTGNNWQNIFGLFSAASLNGDGEGSITVGNDFCLKIDAVDFPESPSGTDVLVDLTLTGEDTTAWYHRGRLYGPNGVAGEAIPVTVDGVATGQNLVYATVNGVSGLYLAVAQYGSNYYATFQDAINARGSGSGDITVLDASAPIPFGYKVSDGKLVRSRKIIFEFR